MGINVNDTVCLKADVKQAEAAEAQRAEALAKGEKPSSVRHSPREYKVLAAFANTLRLKHGDQEVTVDDDKACLAPSPAPAEPPAPTE